MKGEIRLSVTVLGLFTAEGTPEECGMFSFVLLQLMVEFAKNEKEKAAKDEANILAKMCNMAFEDLFKMEQGKDKEGEENNKQE